jgi:Neuraminidase (sialidase)
MFAARWAIAGVGFLSLTAQAASPPPAPRITVLHRATIFVHPASDPYDLRNLHGFNHAPSVVALPGGRLLAAWFSGPFEASVHQVILGAFSADQGRTWSKATVLQDFPRKSDFDPAFLADGRRTWFFFSAGRHNRYPFVRDQKNEVGPGSFNTYYRKSEDSGQTWSAPAVAHEKVFCRSNGIRLSSGELLLPVYDVAEVAGVLKSADGGKTWRHIGGITTKAGSDEPTIAELRSGAILMVLRTGDGYLWTVLSRDKGETWDKPRKTSMVAATTSHNLFRTRAGRLVLTHNESPPPTRTNLTVRVSDDDGQTWAEPFKLAEVVVPGPKEIVWSRQATYPSTAELADGSLVIVWTELSMSDTEQYGDIHAIRIRID